MARADAEAPSWAGLSGAPPPVAAPTSTAAGGPDVLPADIGEQCPVVVIGMLEEQARRRHGRRRPGYRDQRCRTGGEGADGAPATGSGSMPSSRSMLLRRSDVALDRSDITWVNRALTVPAGRAGPDRPPGRPAPMPHSPPGRDPVGSRSGPSGGSGRWEAGACSGHQGGQLAHRSGWRRRPRGKPRRRTRYRSRSGSHRIGCGSRPGSQANPAVTAMRMIRRRIRPQLRFPAARRRLRRSLGIPWTIVPAIGRKALAAIARSDPDMTAQ